MASGDRHEVMTLEEVADYLLRSRRSVYLSLAKTRSRQLNQKMLDRPCRACLNISARRRRLVPKLDREKIL
jgi:hypothetical protein